MSQTEPHIVIGADRYVTVPESLRRIAVSEDHNMETVIFDCPRYWDEHDMSDTNAWDTHINYMLANGRLGSFKANDVTVDDNDESKMYFSWTITEEMTQVLGTITFMVCIRNMGDDGKEIRHWNSEPNDDMYISDGLEPTPEVTLPTADIMTQILYKLRIVDQMIDGLNGVLGGVVEVEPSTVPMRDSDGYLYTKTPTESSPDDTAVNKEYVDQLRSDAAGADTELAGDISKLRSDMDAGDLQIRADMGGALDTLHETVNSEMTAADDEVLSTVRSEVSAIDSRLSGAVSALSAKADENEAADEALAESVAQNEAGIKALDNTVNGTESVPGHEQRIIALEAADEALAESMQTAHNEMQGEINQNKKDIEDIKDGTTAVTRAVNAATATKLSHTQLETYTDLDSVVEDGSYFLNYDNRYPNVASDFIGGWMDVKTYDSSHIVQTLIGANAMEWSRFYDGVDWTTWTRRVTAEELADPITPLVVAKADKAVMLGGSVIDLSDTVTASSFDGYFSCGSAYNIQTNNLISLVPSGTYIVQLHIYTESGAHTRTDTYISYVSFADDLSYKIGSDPGSYIDFIWSAGYSSLTVVYGDSFKAKIILRRLF